LNRVRETPMMRRANDGRTRAMPRAYAITAEAVTEERKRVDGDLERIEFANVIRLDELELPDLGPTDVHLKILAVSGEHNVDHAVLADTVNIAESRGGKIYPGNSAVGEVIEVGDRVTKFKPGDVVITHCNGGPDAYGYPTRIWAYDTEDSVGWYAEEAVVGEWQIIPAPLDCGLNLWEIAALPLRAPTAYHLWRRAEGIFRVKVSRERLATLNVLSFGGGVGECFLMLARHEGHRAYFCSGSPDRRAALEKLGIEGIDQKKYNRFASRDDVRGFVRELRERTAGVGAHVVCDMLRGPVYPAGLQALAREGVNVSAGWQLGQMTEQNSTLMSVRQITLDHTHYETIDGCWAATELYGSVFRPTVHKEIYAFEDLPRAMAEMHHATQTGIPIIRVAEEMPEAVRALTP
jgi:NADPH:quinone reductase-like Zn-dependent oxidoreductase